LHSDGDEDDVSDAPSLHKYAPQVAFQVFHEGKLITRSSNAGQQPMSTVTSGFATVEFVDRQKWRVFATTGSESDIQVYVAEKLDSRSAILWAVLRSMLWPLVFALPFFGLAVWWSVRRGLAPLRHLSDSLTHRQAQALDAVPLQGMPSELLPLAQALNTLLDRIGQMLLSERRFTADAAHELRTPIAAIRAQAQVALGAGDNAAEREHALQATLGGCDRATRLVEQLLTLARLEAAPAAPATPVDLCAVARRIAADLAPVALARQQVLELQAQKSCAVAADEMLLGVLVRNLLDNALRYSPVGARVQVSLECISGQTRLTVEDSGPGMTPAEMARLGERFYRVLGNDQPGSGLGWSIVKRLATVFRAEVAARHSSALGGLAVEVRWPGRPPAD
jgi:two-component system sensor histidine kinase QseC